MSRDYQRTRRNQWVLPLKPAIIDHDRRLNGDHYKKPTQYWFINCKPKTNILIGYVEELKIENVRNQVQRSMIHPQYASRFLRQYVLPATEQWGWEEKWGKRY